MPRIRCLYIDCNFLDDNYCTAPSVEIDPDLGCATYVPLGDEALDDDWEEDDGYDGWNTEDIDEDEDTDDWLDEEDEE
jgi:hypothetical protein